MPLSKPMLRKAVLHEESAFLSSERGEGWEGDTPVDDTGAAASRAAFIASFLDFKNMA